MKNSKVNNSSIIEKNVIKVIMLFLLILGSLGVNAQEPGRDNNTGGFRKSRSSDSTYR